MSEGRVDASPAGSASIPLASALAGGPTSFVNRDVALDSEPVIGSFTVDGLTFAVAEGGSVELVSVEAGAADIALLESVSFEGIEYSVTSIAPYALYLSGATSVELPATVTDVDERAFRSSNVASVDVAEGNPAYASFDGVLYDADLTRLLLIPGGRQGAVRIPSQAPDVPASAFSHCALVTAIDADTGGAAYLSWEGLLYDADGTTLLRVPAGATDITIREGCTTIAAGAMEGCAQLASITAPASITSISPYLFEQQPETVMAPVAVAAVEGDAEDASADEAEPADAVQQLSAMVALTSTDDDLPAVDPAAVAVSLPAGADVAPWRSAGFSTDDLQSEAKDDAGIEGTESEEPDLPVASLGSASTYANAYDFTIVNAEGSTLYQTNSSGTTNAQIDSRVISCGESTHQVHVRFLDKNGSLIVQLWHSATSDNSYYRWVKPGYVLVGVKVTNGAGTVSDEIRATVVGTNYTGASKITGAGRTIAPIFEQVTYTVSFDGNGATTAGSPANLKVKYGEELPAVTTPKRTGYEFLGYYSSTSTAATQYYDASGKSTRTWDRYEEYPTSLSTAMSYTLYAQWVSRGTISFTWDTGNGIIDGNHGPFGRAVTYVDGVTLGDVWEFWSEGRMRYYGYTFQGWYTAATSGTRVYESTPIPTTSTTYYAHWTANTIRTTWNCNGGNIDGGKEHVRDTTYSEDKTLADVWGFWSEGRLRRAGYTFAGWWTAASGGTQVTSSTALPTTSTTYYAHWTANTIRTTWNYNGGTIDGGTGYTTRNTVYAESKLLGDALESEFWSEGRLRRAGYTFAGWWTAASGGTQVTSSTALPTTSTTYYAHWSTNSYAITYELDGGSVSGNPTTYDIETTSFTLKNPTRQGYTFVGWSGTGLEGEANMAVTVAKGSMGDRSYTAHWAPMVSAVVPVSSTVRLDILGTEEQEMDEDAPGYIESRCGEPLDVASVAFEAKAGASELFGAYVADIELQALPGDDASWEEGAPAFSFALDAADDAAIEDDAAKLAGFSMSGYEVRIPIAYRFFIPDSLLEEVLASIDPARFEQVTTPVCSVVYTVALANQGGGAAGA